MKTVFDNRQCAHVWAQQTQDFGRSESMSFRGPVLYSYQTPIAAFVQGRGNELAGTADGRVVLFNSRKYSVTTSGKHMPAAHAAVTHLRSFSVPNCTANSVAEHTANLTALVAGYRADADRLMRVRELWGYSRELLERAEVNVKDYARIFDLPLPGIDSAADYAKAAERLARLDADPKRAARKAAIDARRLAKEAAQQADQLAAFRMGVASQFSGIRDAQGGAYLRIIGDEVQTSLGARVPVADARQAINFIAARRTTGKAWQRNGERCPVGDFQIDSISTTGDIKAGCHFIQWSEIEPIGKALGVI